MYKKYLFQKLGGKISLCSCFNALPPTPHKWWQVSVKKTSPIKTVAFLESSCFTHILVFGLLISILDVHRNRRMVSDSDELDTQDQKI